MDRDRQQAWGRDGGQRPAWPGCGFLRCSRGVLGECVERNELGGALVLGEAKVGVESLPGLSRVSPGHEWRQLEGEKASEIKQGLSVSSDEQRSMVRDKHKGTSTLFVSPCRARVYRSKLWYRRVPRLN